MTSESLAALIYCLGLAVAVGLLMLKVRSVRRLVSEGRPIPPRRSAFAGVWVMIALALAISWPLLFLLLVFFGGSGQGIR